MINAANHPRPIYTLSVDGADITGTVQGRLIDLTLTDNRGFEADQLDITLDDSDGRLALPPRGAQVRLALGWQATGSVPKGTYTVDEVEHSGAPDTLTIHARSADLRTGLTTQRERSWHGVALGAIVRTLANENGLTPVIPSALAAQAIEHIDQTAESAVNLLTRLAGMFDATSTVKDGKLLFMPTAGGVSASGKPLPSVTITRESGDRHRFSIADRNAYTGVKATYNDVDGAVKGEVIWGTAENDAERHVPAPAQAKAPTPTGQYKTLAKTYITRDGAQRAAKKEWDRLKANKAARAGYVGTKAKYNDRNLSDAGEVTYSDPLQTAKADATDDPAPISPSADNVKTLRHVYANKKNALRAARAEWRKIQRGLATFGITLARGRPELFPDLPVTVSGFKAAIDNTNWIITRVVHHLNEGGYTTTVELEIKATEVD